MRMTSAEKLILENQKEMMMALSLLLRKADEITPARSMSDRVNYTASIISGARVWSNE